MARYALLTQAESGGSWVRNIAFAPEVLACTPGLASYAPEDDYERLDRWARGSSGLCGGPFYEMCAEEWFASARADDRAIHILRDPRDRLVSWILALASTTVDAPHLRAMRAPIASLAMRDRIAFAMVAANQVAIWMSRSLLLAGPSVRTVTYERLVADPHAEFAAIFDHFAWRVPDDVLRAVLARTTHDARLACGAWSQTFDRELGRLFEEAFPGALADYGYERDGRWFESLPERARVESAVVDELRDLRRRNRALIAGVSAQHDMLARLAALTSDAVAG